ncbi:MAG TPA: FAD:protein FMN transferase [Candidatus Saccharimonadales bacterium]|nr:FAD:protein FMN transferase [Candidatus Saccharimonadales bacterium]
MSGVQATFDAIGTRWDIRIHETIERRTWSQLLGRIRARIAAFDIAYSRFRSDSLVAAMAQQAGQYTLPPDGPKLLQFYEQLYQATSGKLTPLAGQLLADAGYDADYSFTSRPLQPTPKWEDVLSYSKRRLTLRRPALLDFGAAGKGYLIDIVGALLRAAGLDSYTINAGGDILHRSAERQPLRVGLENPADTSEVLGVVPIGNQSICASSGAKRSWPGFHHIIDPDTLRSPEQLMATWVVARDTLVADGLATALFFTPPDRLRRFFRFSYATLDAQFGLSFSQDFPVQLFAAGSPV